MAFIRTIDRIADKWSTVTPMRSGDYAYGVANPRKPWATMTAAAEAAYEQGIQQSLNDKRFGKGVRKAGDETWLAGCTEKGTTRWGPGVSLAKDKYQRNFAPYRDAIDRVSLPPRYPRRDPRNMERVKAVVTALAKTKEALLGK